MRSQEKGDASGSKKASAPPPVKQAVAPPAPVLVPTPVARPVVAETKPVVQEAPLPVVTEKGEEVRLLDGVDPSFGRTEEYVPPPTTVVQEAPPRRVVKIVASCHYGATLVAVF